MCEATAFPAAEKHRMAALKKYDILDTPADGNFDRITALASRMLNVPIAIVTLVDTDRIWFKSSFGLNINQISRDPGLCASAIFTNDIYLVEDAKKDPRTLANPLVAGEFGLEFYAAAPLTTDEGYNLGTLCVIDKKPRTLSAKEKETLFDLRDVVMHEIELRLAAKKLHAQQNDILTATAHDFKNPITNINVRAELIRNKVSEMPDVVLMCSQIINAGKAMNSLINKMLKSAQLESGQLVLDFITLNLGNVTREVIRENEPNATSRQQQIITHIDDDAVIWADEVSVKEIIDNLINNAIKYSGTNTTITVSVIIQQHFAVVEVTDEGQGFSEEDKNNLYKRFTPLSSKPTLGENSTGLGLSITKNLVDLHKGDIQLYSNGKGSGSRFVVHFSLTHMNVKVGNLLN